MPTKREGWLFKYSLGLGIFPIRNWKKRYFRIHDTSISYYESENGQLKGSISHGSVVRVFSDAPVSGALPSPECSYVFAIQLRLGDKKNVFHVLLLATDSPTIRDEWVEDLRLRQTTQLLSHHVGAVSLPHSSSGGVGGSGSVSEHVVGAKEFKSCGGGNSAASDGETDDDEDGVSPEGSQSSGPSSKVNFSTYMMNGVRGLVSKNKIRMKEGDYDLDLTYITPRIIAMGYPSEGKEALYRNPIGQVVSFLQNHHGSHVKVYNLCSERSYVPATFEGRFERFPFDDHNPPPLALMDAFVHSVDSWLRGNERNVVAVHCKAGKGRTGVMICSYLSTVLPGGLGEAMTKFNTTRTRDGKGVTIPSQIRYMHYYDKLRKEMGGVLPANPRVLLQKVILHTTPHFDFDGGCDPFIVLETRDKSHRHIPLGTEEGSVSNPMVKIYDMLEDVAVPHVCNLPNIELTPMKPVALPMEVRFTLFDMDMTAKEKMCTFWINTAMLPSSGSITLTKSEIDMACKDKKHELFEEDFTVTLVYTIAGKATTREASLSDIQPSSPRGFNAPITGTSTSPMFTNNSSIGRKTGQVQSSSNNAAAAIHITHPTHRLSPVPPISPRTQATDTSLPEDSPPISPYDPARTFFDPPAKYHGVADDLPPPPLSPVVPPSNIAGRTSSITHNNSVHGHLHPPHRLSGNKQPARIVTGSITGNMSPRGGPTARNPPPLLFSQKNIDLL